ncbi:MAG TPA: hypothetical protein EYN06_00920 [Myxococcales bacterium]|nr:hypothetical protein [Myxococcales bacterium]HIN85011.1 hypothetical protein [Myxococcales bacterium]
MLTKASRIIVVALVAFSVGCKKDAEDPAEDNNAQPEKVSKPTAGKAADKAEASPPAARKLVKATANKKPRPARTAQPVKSAVKKKGEAVDPRSPKKPATPIAAAPRKTKDKTAGINPPKADSKRQAPTVGPRKQGPKATPSNTGPRVRLSNSANRRGKKARVSNHSGTPKARPNAELLLRKQDLLDILKIKTGLDVHQLSGLDESGEYDGIYWGSSKGDKYIAGIQVWQLSSHLEAQRRYERMLRSYPNAQESTAITSKTFLANWNDLIYLAFFDPGKQKVISLTCHRRICDSPTKLVKLANRIKDRI